MRRTRYVPVSRTVRRGTDEPIFAIIVTDGSPNDGRRATQLIIELARYPVQIKFLAIREVGYLQEVDDLEEHDPGARLLDNVDAKFFNGVAWPLLTDITDLQFAEAMADELDTWLSDAIAKGVLSL